MMRKMPTVKAQRVHKARCLILRDTRQIFYAPRDAAAAMMPRAILMRDARALYLLFFAMPPSGAGRPRSPPAVTVVRWSSYSAARKKSSSARAVRRCAARKRGAAVAEVPRAERRQAVRERFFTRRHRDMHMRAGAAVKICGSVVRMRARRRC